MVLFPQSPTEPDKYCWLQYGVYSDKEEAKETAANVGGVIVTLTESA